jgi:nucleotide-binding universal stress UspA family protein
MDKDRIVMASHGRTGVTRVVLEKVAAYMRRRTSVPMLLRRMTWPKVA